MEVKSQYNIPITQGARKYNFEGMRLGEHRPIGVRSTSNASNCFKTFAKTRKLDWECSCYKKDGVVYVVRVK